ncbi:MAG TPA: ATP-binding protein [Terracidiphilus sp.]|nr:ATP-binding protein [Terracidiphilus sp.]
MADECECKEIGAPTVSRREDSRAFLGPRQKLKGKSPLLNGITSRVAQLVWTVTLASLGFFIAFIIPEQKRELRQGLEAKAHGIAVALQGQIAGAALSEDYSSVVEQAMQVVAGDPDVQLVVITKSDGYSLVIERQGWRIVPKTGGEWRQEDRTPYSTIGYLPLVSKRLFHYATPFDYSGIPWGWVHVGLSLDTYDKSVRQVYVRTGLLGVVFIFLSLAASILFSRQFVKPILQLRRTVENVTEGDLTARAQIVSSNEIEMLANAFNDMADAVVQRDRIVESVRFAAQALQETDEWDAVVDKVLTNLGEATKVCRALLVQIEEDPATGALSPAIRLEWEMEGVAPYGATWAGRSLQELGLAARRERLARGFTLIEHWEELTAAPIPGPDPQPRSRIAAPILVEDILWGVLVIQDCFVDRDWRDVERSSVRAIADMLGACIVRQRAKTALLDAKNDLEIRVEERTLELRDQIAARDKANSELQLMQKQMIELSRLSGMAEVATGVLHNVGNVLNSVNVSATLLMDHLKTSRVKQLQELSAMLAENSGDLPRFLSSDPRGQRVVPYLLKLSTHLIDERDQMKRESETLVQNVGHIKEIVAMQQGYARTYGVLEKVTPQELLEDALNISNPAIERHHIVLKKEIGPVKPLTTDRHKVLQILLNLIQNAKDAVKAGDKTPRQVTLRLHAAGEDSVRFEVEDNGVGIAPENLTRIFSHGFTTKKSGHGFGLHSGALAAKQLGGALRVQSSGLGCGALFALDLPCSVHAPEP